MRKYSFGAIVALVVIFGCGCDKTTEVLDVAFRQNDPTWAKNIAHYKEMGVSSDDTANNQIPDSERGGEGVYSYGANVFYFAHTRVDFGNILYSFLKLHPDKEVSAIAPDLANGSRTQPSMCLGYFVTFRDKAPAPVTTSLGGTR